MPLAISRLPVVTPPDADARKTFAGHERSRVVEGSRASAVDASVMNLPACVAGSGAC